MFIYICKYMYTCRRAFQAAVRPCRGQRTYPAQSVTVCASGRWVLPGRCLGKSRIGLPTAAPGKYPPSDGTVRLRVCPKKYVDFRSLVLRSREDTSRKNSCACSDEFEMIQFFKSPKRRGALG